MPQRLRLDVLDILVAPALVFLGYALAPLDSRLWLGILVGVAAIGLSLPLLVHRARAVRESQTPLLDALGAIAVFGSVLIASFAALHYTIAVQVSDQYSGIETKIDGLYFTVTTVSTVGFGDLTADGQLARLLVTINILFNLVALGLGLRALTHAAQMRLQERGTRLVPPSSDEA